MSRRLVRNRNRKRAGGCKRRGFKPQMDADDPVGGITAETGATARLRFMYMFYVIVRNPSAFHSGSWPF